MKRTATRILCISLTAVFLAVGAAAMKLPPLTKIDPDTRTDRMCKEAANPDAAPDKQQIHCRLEYGTFAPKQKRIAGGARQLLVAAYNLERGFKLDQQISLLKTDPDLKRPDVLLISESDRGCSRTNYRNVARDLAKALGMNYVYGVEFNELPRKSVRPVDNNETICEHGNAVLSRYPILGAEQIRHKITHNWYLSPGPKRENAEPRIGGNMAIAADIDVAGTPVRVYAIHFDSGIEMNAARGSQAKEIIAHAKGVKYPVIIGGDMNTISYLVDLQTHARRDGATSALLDAGYKDAHSDLALRLRGTVNKSYPVAVIIDLIFLRGANVIYSGVCPMESCNDLSDHLPVWSRISINSGGK